MLQQPSTVLCATRDIPTTGLAEFATRCARSLQAGARLLTLYGHPEPGRAPDAVCVTAVFQAGETTDSAEALLEPDGAIGASATTGALTVVRAHASAGETYPALSSQFPAAQSYERELWEQTGVVPQGHPWLEPIRFEGARQERMGEYPFFSVRGQAVHEVGVGPIHASVIEPGHFRFMCLGEQVQHLEIQLGYQHRHVEALLLQRPPWLLTPLVESICGDAAVAYAWGHCAAIEALAEMETGPTLDLQRGVALELERIAMHVAALGGLATDLAFLQGGGSYGRLRTAIINATQRICGNRFGRGWLRPGRARGLDAAQRADLQQVLAAFAQDFGQVNALLLHSLGVAARLKGVGVVRRTAAQDLGLCGLVARASGVATDVRSQAPGGLYADFPMPLLIEEGGDCWARMRLRMREVQASLHWLHEVLAQPAWDLGEASATASAQAISDPGPAGLRPDAWCLTRIEGARGPVLQLLETDARGAMLHYKVQDPSLPNWFGLAMALRDNAISDFPICNKSFDLSYCGNDL